MLRLMTAGLALTIWTLAPADLNAQEHDGEHGAESQEHGESEGHASEGEHGEGHHLHKHHFAVLFLATEAMEEHDDDGHGETHGSSSKDDPDATIGFDYERRFTQLFGLGGMIDIVWEGRREILLGPIAFLHPGKGSKFWVAPLAERIRENEEWELVVRFGVGWDFPVGKSGKYSISPNINYDIAEEHELWVVGIAVGRGF